MQAGPLNRANGTTAETMSDGAPKQAGAPDQEPMESHGASRGSRSKDDGHLDLGVLNQESIVLLRMP